MRQITIGYLYGDLMNTYGDTGNIIALEKRCVWRGIKTQVVNIPVGYKITKEEFDLFFFGGGQDQSQQFIASDLVSKFKGQTLINEVERGVPLLSICGGYQLLGEYYKPHEGPKLPGVSLFPAYTVAGFKRMIGNIVVSTELCELQEEKSPGSQLITHNLIVGFENHSGKTYLKDGATPLGRVLKGFGNNGEDKTEGCVYKNAVGCYMHGSLLPKNPRLADWLIQKALETKYGKRIYLTPLDDSLELRARKYAIDKFF